MSLFFFFAEVADYLLSAATRVLRITYLPHRLPTRAARPARMHDSTFKVGSVYTSSCEMLMYALSALNTLPVAHHQYTDTREPEHKVSA